jgi:hypothetical protein
MAYFCSNRVASNTHSLLLTTMLKPRFMCVYEIRDDTDYFVLKIYVCALSLLWATPQYYLNPSLFFNSEAIARNADYANKQIIVMDHLLGKDY